MLGRGGKRRRGTGREGEARSKGRRGEGKGKENRLTADY